MLICGIDPGKKGAIAFYDSTMDELIEIHDMPESVSEVAFLFVYGGPEAIDLVVIEEVSSMTYVDSSGQTRGQGSKASFTFGKGFGEILGVCAGLSLKVKLVKPSIWKRLMGLSSDKSASRQLAREKFPSDASFFNRAKDDGRAEAALLALFGAERFT